MLVLSFRFDSTPIILTVFSPGSVLVALTRAYPDITFKALIRPSKFRSEAIVNAIRDTGAQPVSGSLSDYGVIFDMVSESDIVINTADSFDPKLLEAILDAMKKRKERSNAVGSFIQTSGAMIFLDGSTDGKLKAKPRVWTVRFPFYSELATVLYAHADWYNMRTG